MKIDKKNKNILFESDWLASEPYFYSTETGTSSLNINDVIDSIGVKSLDAEGTYNFLDFGYSVFNQTPVSGVKFLPPASKLIKNKNGLFEVETKTDPINQWLEYSLKEKEIIELIRHRVQSWEASLPSDQEIVLPLSGGFDSRLLLWCISDKSRIRAFTYGISNEQVLSTEVVHARALAKTFDIRWEQIELGNFHRFLPNWYAKFGISTHAHGMYQQEFYEKIRNRLQGRKFALLSGIVGDIWAGSVPFKKINSPIDINKLGNTHGQVSKADKLKSKFQHNLRNEFWELNKKMKILRTGFAKQGRETSEKSDNSGKHGENPEKTRTKKHEKKTKTRRNQQPRTEQGFSSSVGGKDLDNRRTEKTAQDETTDSSKEAHVEIL